MVDEQGRIERFPYELCVLVALRDAIRRREVYVDGGHRWRNPEDYLPGTLTTPARSTTPRCDSPRIRPSSSTPFANG